MTVLIVDDHAVVRKGIVSLLREEILGLETAEAADAPCAFQAAMDGNFDLVLLDITLPGRSGLDLLRDLRAARPQLPVLVVSAHAERDYAVRAIKLGAAGYLSKQSAPDALITAVNRILSGRRYLSPEVADLLAGAIGSNTGEIAHDALSNRDLEVPNSSPPASPSNPFPPSSTSAKKPSPPTAPASPPNSASPPTSISPATP